MMTVNQKLHDLLWTLVRADDSREVGKAIQAALGDDADQTLHNFTARLEKHLETVSYWGS